MCSDSRFPQPGSSRYLFLYCIARPCFFDALTFLATRNKEPGVPLKMGLGMIMLGVGFLLMVMACLQRGGDNPDETVKANLLFLVGTYLFHTFGELLLSPIGFSMVTRLAPVVFVPAADGCLVPGAVS